MGPSIDDGHLLARCAERDEEAWRLLVERYENLVFSTALSVGLDREAAADVYQQVWFELHRSLRRIRDAQALPRWLMVTTRRIAYRQAVVAGRWVEELRDDLLDPRPSPDSRVEAMEQRFVLETGLQKLGGRCEQLLRLLFLSERKWSYKQIARKVGIAVGTIGSTRARCLLRLRQILEEGR